MSNLWTLTIATRRGASLALIYDDERKATEAYGLVAKNRDPNAEFNAGRGLPPPVGWSPICEITDAFGTTCSVDRSELMFVWLTDVGAQHEGEKRKQILAAHAQASLQRRLASDPVLKNGAGIEAAPARALRQN